LEDRVGEKSHAGSGFRVRILGRRGYQIKKTPAIEGVFWLNGQRTEQN